MANEGQQAGARHNSGGRDYAQHAKYYYAAVNGAYNNNFIPRSVPAQAATTGYNARQVNQAWADYYSQQNSAYSHHAGNYQQNSTYAANPNYYQQSYYPYNSYPGYYQQQGYGTGAQTAYSTMDYSGYGNQQYGNQQYGNQQYNYHYPPGYDAHAQQQQYQPTPPQIRNPFAPPPPARTQFTAQNAQHDPEYEAQVAQWQSAYAPQDQYDRGKKGGKNDKGENPNFTNLGVRQVPAQAAQAGVDGGDPKAKGAAEDKKKTVIRTGGGQTWEDESLLEWDPTQFRIMVGNLAGEVTDDSLAKAFAQYGVSKARVIRDKRTTKSKGYGFVSFNDSEMGFKAAREMLGKYIGSHPVTIQRAKTDVHAVEKKDKDKGKGKNNKNKGGKNQNDPLRAHTGAHIEKKPVKNPGGYKLLG